MAKATNILTVSSNPNVRAWVRMNTLFDALGFTFGKHYWHEKLLKFQDFNHKERLVHTDPITYSATPTTDVESIKKARTDIFYNHFTRKKVCGLNRRFSYVKFGDSLVPAQRIIAFDIDGRSNASSKAVVRELVSRFPEVKFIEYNPKSNGYHVYIHFDRDVRDESLKRLEADFKNKGFTVEAVRASGHLRLPLGRQYTTYGFYDPKKKTLIRTATPDELFRFWHQYRNFAYFDPAFEMKEEPSYKRQFRNPHQRKQESRQNNKQRLLDQTDLDFGEGERQEKVLSILGSCIRYALPLEDFKEICEAHDKGAREKTDYDDLYKWGKKHLHPDGGTKEYTVDYEDIYDRVQRYSTTKQLSPHVEKYLDQRVEENLIAFLLPRRNVNRNGTFKNESLIKQRWTERIKVFLLYILQYPEAEKEEGRLCWNNDPALKQPVIFIEARRNNRREGVPLPLSLIKFIGKKHKFSFYPEVKSFLESIGMVKAVELRPGVTYAPQTCEYYSLKLPT